MVLALLRCYKFLKFMVSGKLEVFMDSILLDIRQARSTLESISLKMIIGSNLLIQDAG